MTSAYGSQEAAAREAAKNAVFNQMQTQEGREMMAAEAKNAGVSSRIANIRTVEDIDKTIYDHRNQHSTGSDTTAGDKVVNDMDSQATQQVASTISSFYQSSADGFYAMGTGKTIPK